MDRQFTVMPPRMLVKQTMLPRGSTPLLTPHPSGKDSGEAHEDATYGHPRTQSFPCIDNHFFMQQEKVIPTKFCSCKTLRRTDASCFPE